MKYSNERGVKNIRRDYWFAVSPPKQENWTKAFDWCKAHESDGRFYAHYTNTRWWFEKEEDAAFFALRWS